jgi:hypothetical protein
MKGMEERDNQGISSKRLTKYYEAQVERLEEKYSPQYFTDYIDWSSFSASKMHTLR